MPLERTGYGMVCDGDVGREGLVMMEDRCQMRNLESMSPAKFVRVKYLLLI